MTMTPADYSRRSWEAIAGRLTGLREAVYDALLRYGPCTTAELAARMGRSILTVRPRVTELVQLGFAELVGDERGAAGRYAAVRYVEARRRHERAQVEGRQLCMRLEA